MGLTTEVLSTCNLGRRQQTLENLLHHSGLPFHHIGQLVDSWRPGATLLWNLATRGVEEGLVTNDGKTWRQGVVNMPIIERDAKIL